MDRVVEILAKKADYGLLEPEKLSTVYQPHEERAKEAVENFIGENLHLRTSDEATKLLRTAFNVLFEYARPLLLSLLLRHPAQIDGPTQTAQLLLASGSRPPMLFVRHLTGQIGDILLAG